MQCTFLCLVRPRNYLQMLVLLRVLLAEMARWRKKTKSTCNYRFSCTTRPESKIASRRFPRQWPLFSANITSVEQIDSSLAARVATLETGVDSTPRTSLFLKK